MSFLYQTIYRMTWWQKTSILMFVALVITCLMSFLLLVYLSAVGSDGPMRSLLVYSVFPMAIVFIIGITARAQERIDVRSGTSASTHINIAQASPSKDKEGTA